MTEKTMSLEECLACADEILELICIEAGRRSEYVLWDNLKGNNEWIRVIIAKFFDDLPDEED